VRFSGCAHLIITLSCALLLQVAADDLSAEKLVR
jgi:hypothetical protein